MSGCCDQPRVCAEMQWHAKRPHSVFTTGLLLWRGCSCMQVATDVAWYLASSEQRNTAIGVGVIVEAKNG